MKNIKTKILLLAVLAVIGIGMVLIAYFMQTSGTFSGKNNEQMPGQEDAEKGIAIILNVNEEGVNLSERGTVDELKSGKETLGGETSAGDETSEGSKDMVEKAPASEEFAVLNANPQGDGGDGNASVTGWGDDGVGSEPAPLLATGGLGEQAAADEYAVETENATVTASSPEIQNAPSSLESLRQSITNSLNVVVVDKGKVVSNKTIKIENQQSG